MEIQAYKDLINSPEFWLDQTPSVINTIDDVKKHMDAFLLRRASTRMIEKITERKAQVDFSFMDTPGVNIASRKATHLAIIGCGGVGSWFLPKLVKLVNDASRKNMINIDGILIVDGDHVEQSNLIRQNFASRDVGKNKAEVLFKRYTTELNQKISFNFCDKYVCSKPYLDKRKEDERSKFAILPELLNGFINNNRNSNPGRPHLMIINLIDNNVSRRAVHNFAQSSLNGSGNYGISVIDVANAVYNGQLNFTPDQSLIHFNGNGYNCVENIGMHNYWNMLPENMFLEDDISLYDCSVRDQNVVEQLFDINNMAATVLTSFLNTIFERATLYYSQINFSTGNNIGVQPLNKIFGVFHDKTYAPGGAADLGTWKTRVAKSAIKHEITNKVGLKINFNDLYGSIDPHIVGSLVAASHSIGGMETYGSPIRILKNSGIGGLTQLNIDAKEKAKVAADLYDYTFKKRNSIEAQFDSLFKKLNA